jgi:hypothetical protein
MALGATQRHASPLLATAIVAVPPAFDWLLLRKGYAPSTRRAAFTFAGVQFAVGLLTAFLASRRKGGFRLKA